MAKKKKVEVEDLDLDLEDNKLEYKELEIPEKEHKKEKATRRMPIEEKEATRSCLQNKRVIIRHVPKESGMITDPKHVLYGGMAENAVRYYTTPMLQSGKFANVLTNAEKDFLEEEMGLDYNALSIYRKVDNYWENLFVRLTKQDNYLDLRDPEDYIKYKVLLANKDTIAHSISVLQDFPKATYQFVIIEEGQEASTAKKSMDSVMEAYTKFGEIKDDFYLLKTLIELIDGRPVADNSKLIFLQTKVNNIIQSNVDVFLRTVNDEYIGTKVLIKRAISEGIIANRGNYLYLARDNRPLCDNNEEPTLSIAAKYLDLPKNQELKFSIQSKLTD